MHRDGESREHYASLRRRNGSDKHASTRQEQRRLCIVTGKERQGQSMCTATARAGQTMHRNSGATAATEHILRRREQGRLCTDQRQRQSIHCDGESSIDYASLRQSDGSLCIATARAGQTMPGYNGATTGMRRQRHPIPSEGSVNHRNFERILRSNNSRHGCCRCIIVLSWHIVEPCGRGSRDQDRAAPHCRTLQDTSPSQGQTMQGYNGANGGTMAATEHASERQEQRRLLFDTTENQRH